LCVPHAFFEGKRSGGILDIEELIAYKEQEVCNRIPFACMRCAVRIPFYHDVPLAGLMWLLVLIMVAATLLASGRGNSFY